MAVGPKELDIADRMMALVDREIKKIENVGQRAEEKDLIKLEKIAKVYATLMANHRENMKNGVFGKMTDAELEAAVKEFDDETEDGDLED